MMTPMMRKDGTGDPAACLVSAAHVVENSAARLEESAARGRKCEQGKPIRVGDGQDVAHVMMTLMMITISEPVTSRSR